MLLYRVTVTVTARDLGMLLYRVAVTVTTRVTVCYSTELSLYRVLSL